MRRRRKAQPAPTALSSEEQGRDTAGRYQHGASRLCATCGHRFDEHAAVRAKDADGIIHQPCCEGLCTCPAFRTA